MDEVILRPLHQHHLQKKHQRRFPCAFAASGAGYGKVFLGRGRWRKQMLMTPHDLSSGILISRKPLANDYQFEDYIQVKQCRYHGMEWTFMFCF